MIKKYRNYIITGIAVIVVLILAFFANSSENTENNIELPTESIITEMPTASHTEKPIEQQSETPKTQTPAPTVIPAVTAEAHTSDYNKELPKQEEATVEPKTVCSLTVRCDDILKNMDKLKPEKAELIPSDGSLYNNQSAEISDGESAFDVLKRELQNNHIHLEYEYTPMYDSMYIEGINNLYEFDCGELSGWLYYINGVRQNVSSSQCYVKDGDKIEFVYTCDFTKVN